MTTQTVSLQVQIPSQDEFARRFPQYGPFAAGEGRFLFDVVMGPTSFLCARVATEELDLPAVAGVAKTVYEATSRQAAVPWSGFLKQYIGALVCTLMEANGFEKTGAKRAIPHEAFTRGELYRRPAVAAAL